MHGCDSGSHGVKCNQGKLVLMIENTLSLNRVLIVLYRSCTNVRCLKLNVTQNEQKESK